MPFGFIPDSAFGFAGISTRMLADFSFLIGHRLRWAKNYLEPAHFDSSAPPAPVRQSAK
jgi:hypothetical protein